MNLKNYLITHHTLLTVSEIYCCNACCVTFDFKSKFERHVQTDRHKQRAFLTSSDVDDGVHENDALNGDPGSAEYALVISSPHSGDEALSHVDEVKLQLYTCSSYPKAPL